jgi:hypothetical protein
MSRAINRLILVKIINYLLEEGHFLLRAFSRILVEDIGFSSNISSRIKTKIKISNNSSNIVKEDFISIRENNIVIIIIIRCIKMKIVIIITTIIIIL